ncbi:uncharacterized protein V6R79_001960 [Siganus canaliculatus]
MNSVFKQVCMKAAQVREMQRNDHPVTHLSSDRLACCGRPALIKAASAPVERCRR